MPELRWALIGLGALFIVGLALWEWRRSRRRQAQLPAEFTAAGVPIHTGGEAWPQRLEPRIDGISPGAALAREPVDVLLEGMPVIHPAGADRASISVPVAAESAVDVPSAAASARENASTLQGRREPHFSDSDLPQQDGPQPGFEPEPELDEQPRSGSASRASLAPAFEDAAPAAAPAVQAAASAPRTSVPAAARQAAPEIRWPPERADRVLTLRVVNTQGALLSGRAVRLALEQAGLVHGPQSIYHRVVDDGSVLVSVANMLRPGDLDPAQMDEQQFRGLSLFSVLPGVLPPVRMLEELVAVARAIAWRVSAVVQDDQGHELDGDRLVNLRRSLADAPEETGS